MRVFILLIFSLLLFLQCSNDASTTNEGSTQQSVSSTVTSTQSQEVVPIQQPSTASPNTDTLEDGTVVHKASPIGPLATGIWVYDGVLNMKVEQQQTKGDGRWLKFETDMTFSYGQYDKRLRNGKWNFLEDENIIELIYDDTPDVMEGFKIQSSGDAMVLKGLFNYKTNGIMIRMTRQQAYPEKQ